MRLEDGQKSGAMLVNFKSSMALKATQRYAFTFLAGITKIEKVFAFVGNTLETTVVFKLGKIYSFRHLSY